MLLSTPDKWISKVEMRQDSYMAVPFIHSIKKCFLCVDDERDALVQRFELPIGDYCSISRHLFNSTATSETCRAIAHSIIQSLDRSRPVICPEAERI